MVLLGFYSYMMTVELGPGQPGIYEILVWVWASTMWVEELRQVINLVIQNTALYTLCVKKLDTG